MFNGTRTKRRELQIAISLLQRRQPLDVNTTDNAGSTPLSCAITEDGIPDSARTELVAALLGRPDVDVNRIVNGKHPLILADECGQADIVALLLADPRLDRTACDFGRLSGGKGKEVDIRIVVTEALREWLGSDEVGKMVL